MSGGSFGYLCYKHSEDLVTGQDGGFLQEMLDYLNHYGWTEESAQTQEVVDLVQQIKERMEELDKKIAAVSDVWHAVEWKESNEGSDLYDKLMSKYGTGKRNRLMP